MKSDPDVKKRQQWHALYLVASGQTRHRQDVATTLGVHRHSVAAWFAANAAGGVEQALQYAIPRPTRARRLTDTAPTALHNRLRTPDGFASYGPIRTWLAEQHQVQLSYSSVYAVVHDELGAKPKSPCPSHEKKPGRRDAISESLRRATSEPYERARRRLRVLFTWCECWEVRYR
jgi:transposase